MRFLILFSIVFLSLQSHAEALSPVQKQAKIALERYAPIIRFHDYATAFGDVNGDGVEDFVTFIGDPLYNDSGVEDLRMAVFLGTKNNTFKFYDVSLAILGHERVFHALEIKRQSIFLHRDGSGGCCSHWVEEFQFKIRDGRLALIGLETAEIHPEGVADPDTGSSANLVTGQVIKWTDVGKKRREKKMKVPALKPVPLKDFDYNDFSEKMGDSLW